MAARPRRATVRALAEAAGADLDEALVTLWEEGLEYVASPDDYVVPTDVRKAKRALGLATRAELRSSDYWQSVLAIDHRTVVSLLDASGLALGNDAGRLPRGAVSVLKAEARRRGINPLTGAMHGHTNIQRKKGVVVREKVPALEWRTPGHEKELSWLTEDQVLAIHFDLVRDFAKSNDPIDPPGVRDDNLLGSAVFRPQTSIGGTLKYPTIETAAAALLHAIIQDHPFHNGNKRTALVSMLVFLDENGVVPTCTQDDLFKLVLRTAQHSIANSKAGPLSDREVLAIADWIFGQTRLIEKGERVIPWRKLRVILREYGCTLETAPGVGNRMNIQRVLETSRGFLVRRKKRIQLHTQVFYGDDGRDVDIDVIKKIRADLRLDERNGVDSHDFYGKEPATTEDFILRYRKTLYRLAGL